MKRILALCLLAVLCLSGCLRSEEPGNTVTFYYQRTETAYGSSDGVIASEQRVITAANTDLHYLLSLYMNGPVDESLTLPLPGGTRLTDIRTEDGLLTLVFSSELSGLENMDLSISCACISYTCFSLTDAERVRIEAPAANYGTPVSFTASRDSFLLYDDTTREPDAS